MLAAPGVRAYRFRASGGRSGGMACRAVLVVNRASPSTDDLDLTRSCMRSRRETDPARHGIAVDVSFDALAAVGICELLRRPLTNAELTDAPGTRSSVHYDRSAI